MHAHDDEDIGFMQTTFVYKIHMGFVRTASKLYINFVRTNIEKMSADSFAPSDVSNNNKVSQKLSRLR